MGQKSDLQKNIFNYQGAAADFLFQWWQFERKLKMSKQEIKEEFKQMEGDPQIKSKIKQRQQQMAQTDFLMHLALQVQSFLAH